MVSGEGGWLVGEGGWGWLVGEGVVSGGRGVVSGGGGWLHSKVWTDAHMNTTGF